MSKRYTQDDIFGLGKKEKISSESESDDDQKE